MFYKVSYIYCKKPNWYTHTENCCLTPSVVSVCRKWSIGGSGDKVSLRRPGPVAAFSFSQGGVEGRGSTELFSWDWSLGSDHLTTSWRSHRRIHSICQPQGQGKDFGKVFCPLQPVEFWWVCGLFVFSFLSVCFWVWVDVFNTHSPEKINNYQKISDFILV